MKKAISKIEKAKEKAVKTGKCITTATQKITKERAKEIFIKGIPIYYKIVGRTRSNRCRVSYFIIKIENSCELISDCTWAVRQICKWGWDKYGNILTFYPNRLIEQVSYYVYDDYNSIPGIKL